MKPDLEAYYGEAEIATVGQDRDIQKVGPQSAWNWTHMYMQTSGL